MKVTGDYVFPEGNYSMRPSSGAPRLLVLLLDLSQTMGESIDGKKKISLATDVINHLIDRIVFINFNGERPKDRYYISVIGYSDSIRPLCSGFLSYLDENPAQVVRESREVADGAGGLFNVEVVLHKWVDISSVSHSKSDLSESLKYATELVSAWVNDHPEIPAPIIVNISDLTFLNVSIPESVVSSISKLKSVSSSDGPCLFYSFVVGSSKRLSIIDKECEHPFRVLVSAVPENHQEILRCQSLFSDNDLVWNNPMVNNWVGFTSVEQELWSIVTADPR